MFLLDVSPNKNYTSDSTYLMLVFMFPNTSKYYTYLINTT